MNINDITGVSAEQKKTDREDSYCHKCGREISKPYGSGREILLRHLSVFGRKTYIRIRPPRYQCIRCEGSPVTTQKAVWYEQEARIQRRMRIMCCFSR